MKYSFLENRNIKNKRIKRINESKQVGIIYHCCPLDAVVEYIAPEDILQGSGTYNNWLIGGDTNVVSFTRNKGYVLETWRDSVYPIVFQFEVDGNLVSENHKVFPYNDFHYDYDGEPVPEDLEAVKARESEEVVKGALKHFSTYIKKVYFDVTKFPSLKYKKIWKDFLEYLKIAYNYIKQFKIEQNRDICSKEEDGFKFETFEKLIEFVNIINISLDGTKIERSLIKTVIEQIPLHWRTDWLRMFISEGWFDYADVLIKIAKKEGDKAVLNEIEGEEYLNQALFSAIDHDKIETVKEMIECGANVNAFNDEDMTPLLYAISREKINTEIVKILILNGAKTNIKDSMDRNILTLLCHNCENNNVLEIAEILLKKDKRLVEDCPPNGYTPLLNAIHARDIELVNLLLKYGADPNHASMNGMLPLIKAIRVNDRDIVKILLKHDVDVNRKDMFGNLPIIEAIKEENIDIIKLLLKHNVNLNLKDKNRMNAFEVAKKQNNKEILEIIEND